MSGGMIFILVIFVVIRIIAMDAQQKKKRAEQQRQAPQTEQPDAPAQRTVPFPAQGRARQRPAPRRSLEDMFPELTPAERVPVDDRFPEVAARSVQPARPRPRPVADPRFPDLTPAVGSMAYESIEGGGPAASMAYDSQEGGGPTGSLSSASVEGVGSGSLSGDRLSHIEVTLRQTPAHVVKALTESDHRHTESSMTGPDAPCPPDAPAADVHDAAYAIAATPAPATAFAFDRQSAMRGLLYAEILGKPKALRR